GYCGSSNRFLVYSLFIGSLQNGGLNDGRLEVKFEMDRLNTVGHLVLFTLDNFYSLQLLSLFAHTTCISHFCWLFRLWAYLCARAYGLPWYRLPNLRYRRSRSLW